MAHDNENWLGGWHRRGFSTPMARIWRAHILSYKARLRQSANSGASTAAERLNRKRFAADKSRKLRRQLLRPHPPHFAHEVVAVRHVIRQAILDDLYPRRLKDWRPVHERTQSTGTVLLRDFSFVDEPANTMELLRQIAEMETTKTEGRLDFIDPLCLDIGPLLVLQAMHTGMVPLFTGGRISASVQRVLEMVGLRSALGMHFVLPAALTSVWPLPFRTRSGQGDTPNRLLRNQTSEVVTTDVVQRINDWLIELAHVELTPEGERLALQLTGEALDNAERHSDLIFSDGSWSVAGFVARRRENNNGDFIYRCHLGLLSIGASIAESIQSASPRTTARMGDYVRRHRGTFRRFSDENLQTVFALQDGVSRVHGRGGTGLMDIVEFFAALSGTSDPERRRPRLAIVSGATCIRVQPPYIQGTRSAEPGPKGLRQPRELWFNRQNDPQFPPDNAHLISLPARLAGTLITMAWTMDEEFLQGIARKPK